MPKEAALDWSPFEYLDAYNEESFGWANNVWNKISPRLIVDTLDLEMVSITFAKVYSDFCHVSFGLHDDFEEYLSELYGEDKKNEKWELMQDYRKRIYDAMLLEHGSSYKIFETFEASLLEQTEDDTVSVDPMSFEQKGNALGFIDSGFRY